VQLVGGALVLVAVVGLSVQRRERLATA